MEAGVYPVHLTRQVTRDNAQGEAGVVVIA